MAKYDPLEQFLSCTPSHLNNIVFSFAQIEQIIGTSLPPNAYNPKGTWWRNTRDLARPQSRAWLTAGWKQDVVSWNDRWVRFRRQRTGTNEKDAAAQPENGQHPPPEKRQRAQH